MKPWEKRRGRVAAGVSVSLHVAVYLALAAGGFFTLIHHYTRQDGVTGVMVYNADDLAGAGGHDAAGTDTDEGRVSQPDGRDRGPEGPESPESSDRAVAASDVASPDPDEAGADGMTYAAKTESGKGEPSVKGAAKGSQPSAQAGTERLSGHTGSAAGGRGWAAGPGKDEAAAPAGNLHVPDAVADVLDAIREKLPVKLSEAKMQPLHQPSHPISPTRQSLRPRIWKAITIRRSSRPCSASPA